MTHFLNKNLKRELCCSTQHFKKLRATAVAVLKQGQMMSLVIHALELYIIMFLGRSAYFNYFDFVL